MTVWFLVILKNLWGLICYYSGWTRHATNVLPGPIFAATNQPQTLALEVRGLVQEPTDRECQTVVSKGQLGLKISSCFAIFWGATLHFHFGLHQHTLIGYGGYRNLGGSWCWFDLTLHSGCGRFDKGCPEIRPNRSSLCFTVAECRHGSMTWFGCNVRVGKDYIG